MRLRSHVAVAVEAAAFIQPLAKEIAYAMGAALKKKKKKADGSSRRGAVVNESD